MAILFEKSDSQRKKKRKKLFDDGDDDQAGPMWGGGAGGVGSATVGGLQEPHCAREDGAGGERKLLLGEAVEV